MEPSSHPDASHNLAREATGRRISVFFYGLFMDEALLRQKGADPKDLRVASVSGFALRVGQRATLVPAPHGRAFGIVVALTHSEIEKLYSEQSVSCYRPEAILVTTDTGMSEAALCFNLPEIGTDQMDIQYATQLSALARRLGFPEDYVASISALE